MTCVSTRCPQCKSEARFQFATSDDAEAYRRRLGKEDSSGRFELTECLICGWGGIKRSQDLGGYFNRELMATAKEWPQMGELCTHCNLRIPRFLDLPAEVASRARAMTSKVSAIRTIVEATGCPIYWAQLWVEHPEGRIKEPFKWPGPPCFYCSKPLRTKAAKQCLECGMDWHDPENVRKLG